MKFKHYAVLVERRGCLMVHPSCRQRRVGCVVSAVRRGEVLGLVTPGQKYFEGHFE